MLFAEVSDTVWLAIIGIVAMVVKDYLDRRRTREATKKVDEKLEVIHSATNGMSVRLEQVSKQAGMAEGTAAGLAQGRAEASEKDRHTPAT